MSLWVWIVILVIMVTGSILVISFILKLIGASIRFVIKFIFGMTILLVLAVIIISILNVTIEPGLWQTIIDWLGNIGYEH